MFLRGTDCTVRDVFEEFGNNLVEIRIILQLFLPYGGEYGDCVSFSTAD
jgi:hypothetical protein